ncbi:NAD(P)/FAD-dependent oxidoreductase [Limnoglobus roseus]|uniref:NAD(P)/FAD-dependent oxidoreductase n=1 Tax=Limnoglobus roseus TaxID=2598579 RepID=A0A5C1AC89_9BACT|nr:NAD(P)/FAD-dependent oxidoreductase [Limnoglobus roseus]QEL15656.1 NAD(P)/FAD-dependent oxidoreductase [Limnoglobus roseus]
MDKQPDVVVIGGGPAGSTAATILAQHGHSVTLLEREKFPRFHIGESFMPDTYWILRRLGMVEKMKTSDFVQKYSVQFVNASGQESQPFYFFENNPHECSQTWQVLRSEFDEILLRNSESFGVDVREETRVLDVLFDGDRQTGVRIRNKDGTDETLTPKVVVDASGQSSVIAHRLKLRQTDPKLQKASVWSYFKGAKREPGKFDVGATLVLQLKDKKGWFWYIPQHNDVVSVGVVAEKTDLFRDDSSAEEIFWREVENCPAIKQRIEGSERVDVYRTTKDYTYRSTRCAGDGWVLVGDAFGFLDPIYSTGLQLAFRSGSMAADAISEAIKANDFSAAQLGKWGPDFVTGMDRIRKLVYAFYEGFNFGAFVRKYPHHKRHITDLLIGDFFKDAIDEVWEPLADVIRSEAEKREMATA